jgi:DNA invertase Pin-like site-specific DNA recombinase
MIPVTASLRWSNVKQDNTSSEPRQRANISAFATAKGWVVTEWITDAGVSAKDGYNLRHGKIAGFRADVMAGRRPPGILVVEEPDRLTRAKIHVALEFISPLINRGMTIAFANQNIVLGADDDNALISLLQTSMHVDGAEKENTKRRGRVIEEAKLRRAKFAPGTLYSARVPDWLTAPKVVTKGQHDRAATLHPTRHPRLVEIFEMTASGYGSQRLAKWLNLQTDKKYAPWRGAAWTPNVIANLTSNRAVLGEFQSHRVEPRPGSVANMNTKHKRRPLIRIPEGPVRKNTFPVAIKMDLWDRVQAAKSLRAQVKTGRPSRQMVNLFSGLCRCGVCGSSMHLKGHNNAGKNDWLLCGRHTAGCNNTEFYSVTRLERAFLRQGFDLLQSASDFADTSATIDALALALDQAKMAAADVEAELINVKTNLRAMMRTAASAEMQAMMQDEFSDAVRRNSAADQAVGAALRALTVARGDAAEQATENASRLVDDVRAGHVPARVAMAELLRKLIGEIKFVDGQVIIEPRRPVSVSVHDADGMRFETPPVRSRHLVVEFLPGNRGRRIIPDAERIRIV